MKKIILMGAPNCGKSSVFNMLTGLNTYVGNRAGVTVKAAEGRIRGAEFDGEELILTDIPGIGSLIPSTADEEIASELLFGMRGDLFVNVVDAANLKNQLPLTLRLIELSAGKCPFLLCLTMRDVLEKRGAKINVPLLSQMLGGVPVIFISAAQSRDSAALKDAIISAFGSGRKTKASFPSDYLRREAFVAEVCGRVLSDGRSPAVYRKAIEREEKLEALLSRGWTGVFFFTLSILSVMFLAFGPAGNFITSLFERYISGGVSSLTDILISKTGIEGEFFGLLLRGIASGAGAVLSLFPRILIVSLCLAVFEDCGYMARGAALCDPFMKKIGLDGRAAVAAILGFGCTVPAVMSCRNMTECGRRTVCISALPVISCSARIPVYSLIAGAFFGRAGWVVALLIHLLGAVVFLFLSAILGRAYVKSPARAAGQIFPPLRLPYPKYILKSGLYQIRHFLRRAGGLILGVTCLLFLLMSYSPDFSPASPANSILAHVGNLFVPFLAPLGFGSWEAAVSLLCGLGAKEAVISALYALCPAADGGIMLSAVFTPASALSFLVFFSMYLPCVATIFTMASEIGIKKTVFALLSNLVAAYSLSMLVYRIVC